MLLSSRCMSPPASSLARLSSLDSILSMASPSGAAAVEADDAPPPTPLLVLVAASGVCIHERYFPDSSWVNSEYLSRNAALAP